MFLCLLILDFVLEILNVVAISQNDYFESTYMNGYLAVLGIFLVAVALAIIYLIVPDSKWSRELVPWAFIIASIASYLIVIWIVTYIGFMYPYNSVYVKKSEEDIYYSSGDSDDTPRTKKAHYSK